MRQHQPNPGVLVHPDGSTVTCLEWNTDDQGEYLLVEHNISRNGAINGPHWHPSLTETFTIIQGTMRFRVDGKDIWAGPSERLTVTPGQVHQFWNESDGQMIMRHEIRPPGNHWQMFMLIHKLETEGKLNKKGIPSNPLWLGLAWKSMDGYIAGLPVTVQKVVMGGLARIANALGYTVNGKS
jgi:quercetin dioxygenase-like cupin family protein